MAKKPSKEVAKTGGGAVVGYDYGDESGAGFEGTKGSDLSIPFLAILQSNSPQVETEDPKGSKSGMIYNTVTRELIKGDDGIPFMPVHKDHVFVEWVPRNKGGGFVGLHDPSSQEVKDAIARNDGQRIGKLLMASGNELIETHYVYGLLLTSDGADTTGFAVVSYTSTKIKPCRDWFTAMYTMKGRPPLFANRAKLTTVKQQNDKGTFYNFRIDPLLGGGNWAEALINPATEGALLTEAREFREMVTSGMARAAFETQDAAGKEDPENEGKPPF